MFEGEGRCALDEKGRFNFPARFREEIGETFKVTRWLEDCLVAMPMHQWERLKSKLMTDSLVKGSKVRRKLFGGAVTVSPDKQGRILLTPELREHAGIDKEIAVLGVGEVVEIWSLEALRAMDMKDESDEIEAAMLELGI